MHCTPLGPPKSSVISNHTYIHLKKPSWASQNTFIRTTYNTAWFERARADGPHRGASNCKSSTKIHVKSFWIYTLSMSSYASVSLSTHPDNGHWPWWCSRPDCPSIGFTAPARDTRQELGISTSNEVYSDVEHACLDLPSSGSPRWCSSRLSRQATKDESTEARGGRCAQRDKGCAYLQMAHDQSEGSSPLWHKLVHILLLKTPMSCSHSYLQVPGWLEIIIPCIHEMD